MKSLNQIFVIFLVAFFTTGASATTKGLPPMNMKFGLEPSPSSPAKKSHRLPRCDSNPQDQSTRNLIRQGQCLGKVTTYEKKPGIYMVSEEQMYDSIVTVIARNPSLVSLAKFLKICRPLRGYVSEDGLLCMYRKTF